MDGRASPSGSHCPWIGPSPENLTKDAWRPRHRLLALLLTRPSAYCHCPSPKPVAVGSSVEVPHPCQPNGLQQTPHWDISAPTLPSRLSLRFPRQTNIYGCSAIAAPPPAPSCPKDRFCPYGQRRAPHRWHLLWQTVNHSQTAKTADASLCAPDSPTLPALVDSPQTRCAAGSLLPPQ